MTAKIRFAQQAGRKGRAFVVLAGIVSPPDGELLWQEVATEDDLPSAIREMERVVLQRMDATPVSLGEKREALSSYEGGPLIVIERTEILRHAIGYVSAPLADLEDA